MAQVTYHGETFPVPDSDTALLDYYRGEGADVVVGEQAAAARFPMVRQPGDDAPHPVEVEQGVAAAASEAAASNADLQQTTADAQSVVAAGEPGPEVIDRPKPGPGDDPAA